MGETTGPNRIRLDGFSNPHTERLYRAGAGFFHEQCGGCAFFAPLNGDWGLCLHDEAPHFTETVFEHFGCAKIVNEGWGRHSFTDPPMEDV